MEVWPISRHLEEFKNKYEYEDSQCVFVAPSIFADTKDKSIGPKIENKLLSDRIK